MMASRGTVPDAFSLIRAEDRAEQARRWRRHGEPRTARPSEGLKLYVLLVSYYRADRPGPTSARERRRRKEPAAFPALAPSPPCSPTPSSSSQPTTPDTDSHRPGRIWLELYYISVHFDCQGPHRVPTRLMRISALYWPIAK